MKRETIKSDYYLYGKSQFFDPDMNFMFIGSKKKCDWYLSRNLVKVLEVDEEGFPLKLQLLFKPKGTGYGRTDTDYEKNVIENKCVVSGCTDINQLTRHHIVPAMYRKHFPESYKDRNPHDIVLLRRDLHDQYEKFADFLKDQIAKEVGYYTMKDFSVRFSENGTLKRYVTSLMNPDLNMEHRIYLSEKFRERYKMIPTYSNLKELSDSFKDARSAELLYGKHIIERVSDLQDFVETWRNHFITTMDPEFMPKGWEITRSIHKNI